MKWGELHQSDFLGYEIPCEASLTDSDFNTQGDCDVKLGIISYASHLYMEMGWEVYVIIIHNMHMAAFGMNSSEKVQCLASSLQVH